MTRTRSILILVLAVLGAVIAAVPAGASDEYRSVSAITAGGSADREQPGPVELTSVNASVGADSSAPAVIPADSTPSSLNAILATGSEPRSSSSGGRYERTATELGQAVGEPGEHGGAATALYARTPTEVGQRVAPPVTPSVDSSGFDWGDAAIGAGTMFVIALLGSGAVVALNRRRHATGSSRVPAVSR